MEKIYAVLLINKTRTWASVPTQIKSKVDDVLKSQVAAGMISQAQYDEIMAS